MKKLSKLLWAVAALFAFSCATDTTEDLGVQVDNGIQTSLTISLEGTKTHIGEKSGDSYPLYWSEGDKIAVNGVASEALAAEADGQVSAVFEFKSELTYPYNIVYPSPAFKIDLELGGVRTEGSQKVSFLAEQPYRAGSFAEGAAPLYGQIAAAGEAINLHHLAGVLRLAPKGEGVTLTSMTVTVENGKIAGDFAVDCSNGTLVANDDATNVVTVTFGEGLTLGAEATPIYVALPAGEYGEIEVVLSTATDNMAVKFNSVGEKAVKAGVIREFAEFTYAATATNETFVIDSKEALISFASNPIGSAVVTANIDMTGEAWTTIAEYGAHTFDGGNFEIKGLSAPLFGSVYGDIKNVKLVDVNYTETTNVFSGAIACQLYGTMTNSSVSGEITINNTSYTGSVGNYADVAYAGVVGLCNGGVMTNCTNNAKITLVSLAGETTCAVNAGGVVGGAVNGCKFNGLVNNGDITFSGSTKKNFYLSGVVGRAVGTSGQVPFTELNNCTNNGDITQTAESVCGQDLLIGGITGVVTEVGKETVFSNLKNTGDITLGGKCRYAYGAGIVSYTATSSFENCENTGKMTIAKGAQQTSGKLIGLIYQVSGGSVKNCHNYGALTVGDDITFGHLVKLTGLVDTFGGDGAEMTNCTNSGTLTVGSISNTNDGNNGRLYMAGLVSTFNAGTISHCQNLKSAKFTTAANNFAYGFMIGGLIGYISPTTSLVDQVITLADCENKADLDIKTNAFSTIYLGGILGQLWANKADLAVNFVRVKNNGNITLGGTCTAGSYVVGGITSYVLAEMHHNDCHNTGNVTVETTGDVENVYQGGFIGFSSHRTQNSPNACSFTNCSNSGKVVLKPTNVTGMAQIGGFIGRSIPGGKSYITVGEEIDEYSGCSNSGEIEVCGNGTIKNLWAAHFAGYMQQGSMLTDCTATTSSKITVSIAKITTNAITGWTGHCQQYSGGDKYSFVRCSNYGTVNATSTGFPKFCHSGLVGSNYEADISVSGNMTVEAIDCVVKTTVNLSGKTTGAFAHGGFCRYPYGGGSVYTIKNFKNESTVNVTGNIGDNIESGGLCGYISATLLVDKDTEIKENFTVSGKVTKYVGYGGYWGNINHGSTTDKYEGTYSGNITITGTIGTNVVVGGIGGQHKAAIQLDNVVSAGTIRFGTPEKPLTINGTYVRIGGISCGGATGYDDDNLVHSLNNVVNLTDITVENTTMAETVTSVLVGGIFGYCSSPVDNATSYCNMKVVGVPIAQVGMFSGSARSTTSLATNFKVGGAVAGEYNEEEDEYSLIDITSSNFHKYIYGSGKNTDWTGTDNYDGGSCITSAPTL